MTDTRYLSEHRSLIKWIKGRFIQVYKYIYIYIYIGLWCLTPCLTIFQLYRGGQSYWSTDRNPLTCRRSLTNIPHRVVSNTHRHQRVLKNVTVTKGVHTQLSDHLVKVRILYSLYNIYLMSAQILPFESYKIFCIAAAQDE